MNESRPTNPFSRVLSLVRTGPRALLLRFYDQIQRLRSGHPVWSLSRVAPGLYIGGQHRPKGWAAMQAEGISAVVNLREPHHDDAALGIAGERHLHLPTRDNTPPRLEDLQRAAQFIATEIAHGGKVYVHCGIGVGRAPSAAAAYLIRTGMSTEEALRTIKRVRPFVHLTPGQRRQLQAFEHSLKVD